MNTSSLYLRTFAVGALWFVTVAIKMVSRHPGHWSTYPPRDLMVLLGAWIITAVLLGVAATRWEWLRSWVMVSVGTILGSLVVMGLMVLTAVQMNRPAPLPNFKSTDAMMEHLANEASRWVKTDRGVELDYSLDSIKVIEEELARISTEIDPSNPQQGTFGVAMGYGAYIGEVFRRRAGGSLEADHSVGGPQSYPLTTRSNVTIFPVSWCWKRLTTGEEDNVYHKAIMFSQAGEVVTNVPPFDLQTGQTEKNGEPSNGGQPLRSETTSPADGSRR